MNFNNNSWILDTETTGFDPETGDKLIEIGAIEINENKRETGRTFHEYVDPQREIPESAVKVHGLRREDCIQLGNGQLFKDIAERFYSLVRGSTLIIHNAAFDVNFINYELMQLNKKGYKLDPSKHQGDTQFRNIDEVCKVFCSLKYANAKNPGKRNNLDALCKFYGISTEGRDLHGALLDSQLLLNVYQLMTIRQNAIEYDSPQKLQDTAKLVDRVATKYELPMYSSDLADVPEHEKLMARVNKESGGNVLWK